MRAFRSLGIDRRQHCGKYLSCMTGRSHYFPVSHRKDAKWKSIAAQNFFYPNMWSWLCCHILSLKHIHVSLSGKTSAIHIISTQELSTLQDGDPVKWPVSFLSGKDRNCRWHFVLLLLKMKQSFCKPLRLQDLFDKFGRNLNHVYLWLKENCNARGSDSCDVKTLLRSVKID